MPPGRPRYGMGGTLFNGQMWVAGGAWGVSGAVTNYYGGVYKSGDGAQWSETIGDGNSFFGNRYSPGFVSYNGLLWVIGGNENGTLKNDVWSSPDGTNWTLVTAHAGFTPREDFISLVYNNAIWVIGGWDNSAEADIWTYTTASGWVKVTPVINTSAIPSFGIGFRGRWGSAGTVFNGLIYIYSGCAGSPYEGSLVGTGDGDVWSFDGTNLVLLADGGVGGNPVPVVYHQLSANNGYLYLTTGIAPGANVYPGNYTSTDCKNWSFHTGEYLPRCGHTALSYNSSVYVMGGYDPTCWQASGCAVTYYNDVWKTQ